jgi:formylglycine-generating enzyme required for sulfatase activity
MVTVGNAGNRADTTTGYGAVNYNYQIGQYEVTSSQYTAFLNAVATSSDSHGLYSTLMTSTYGCNIKQINSGSSYTYKVDSDWSERPVNYVSLYDAARYANWLTTGDTENGVYTFAGNVLSSVMDHQLAAMTFGTAYFIPTENEWYKAAYHNSTAGTAASYYLYPTKSNSAPSNTDPPADSGNTATFYTTTYTIDSPYYRTEAGDHENSASSYGTYDQGGNVFEWTENSVLRGGSFYNDVTWLASTVRSESNATCQYARYGFRVASMSPSDLGEVPEPASLAIWLTGALGLLVRMRQKRPHGQCTSTRRVALSAR